MQLLKFVNEEALDLGDAFGMTQEKRDQLSKKLDEMGAYYGPHLTAVPFNHIIQKIELFCGTPEEFTWCVVNHLFWQQRTGRLIQLRQKKQL